MWSRSTKIKVLVAILAAWVLIMVLAIWLAVRSGKLPETAGRVMRGFVESMPDAEQAKQELQAEIEQIRAAGEPMTIKEIIPPQVPDEENAALLYQQAFDALDLSEADKDLLADLQESINPNPQGPHRVYEPEPGEPPLSPPGPGEAPAAPPPLDSPGWHWEEPCTVPPPSAQLQPIVAKNARAIALLEKAAQRPKCRFPVNWEAGSNVEFPHYGKLRACARLLPAVAVLQLRRGDAAGALYTLEIGLAMCTAIRDEPLLISQLVRYAIVSILLCPLHMALDEAAPPTTACHDSFAFLQRMEFRDSFARALLGERAQGVWAFDYVREDPERLADVLEEDSKSFRALAEIFGGPLIDHDEATYLRLMGQQIAAGTKPYRESYGELAEIEGRIDEEVRPACVLSAILLPVFTRAAAKRDSTIAQTGLAQAALALKAYENVKGCYPESLAQLPEVIDWADLPEDPFSGEDFIYRREDEGFLIYSIGADLEDDGGKAEKDWEKGDIVWRCRK